MKYNAHVYVDHLGNEFSSETALLEYYNVAKTTFHRKQKEGVSLEEILTKWQRKQTIWYDHLGNKFDNQAQMLAHYNVTDHNYRYGMKNNIPLEQILTKRRHNSIDHTGQSFKTMKDMCNHWHISINSVKRRLKSGWSLERALTEPQHRPFSFPKIIYDDTVKKHISIKQHIDENYFLCHIDNKDIILSKTNIINYAIKLKQNK